MPRQVQTSDAPPERKKKETDKVYGMKSAIRQGRFTFNGWPLSHVVSCLWGSKGKLVTAMGHHNMCAPAVSTLLTKPLRAEGFSHRTACRRCILGQLYCDVLIHLKVLLTTGRTTGQRLVH